jgi:hypothetical protein
MTRNRLWLSLPAMLLWAVVSDATEEAVELFTSREEAEAIVQA